jgi:hypothetical protein
MLYLLAVLAAAVLFAAAGDRCGTHPCFLNFFFAATLPFTVAKTKMGSSVIVD